MIDEFEDQSEGGPPFFAIGNDELEALPNLTGEPKACKNCGRLLPVKNIDKEKILQIIECDDCGKSYVVGIHGKDLKRW